MKNIKVLGSGCVNCITTAKLIEEVAKQQGEEIKLEKVEDITDIMAYGVMSTPAVVIEDKVVHTGGVPNKKVIESWF